MVAKVFNTFTFTAGLQPPEGMDSETSTLAIQRKLKEVRDCVKKLIISLFKDASLIEKIIEAKRLNDYNESSPKGTRLGYMGHLMLIADETCKLFEKCGPELDADLHVSENWSEFVNHSLRQTQENDRQPLGGAKPDGVALAQGAPRFSTVDSDIQPLSKSDSVKKEGFPTNSAPLIDDTFQNDQFARYLCQQLVKDLPDHFLGADSSEDEEDRWIGGLDEEAVEMDIGEAILGDAVGNSIIPDTDELASDDSDRLADLEERRAPTPANETPVVSPQNSWVDFSKMRLD